MGHDSDLGAVMTRKHIEEENFQRAGLIGSERQACVGERTHVRRASECAQLSFQISDLH